MAVNLCAAVIWRHFSFPTSINSKVCHPCATCLLCFFRLASTVPWHWGVLACCDRMQSLPLIWTATALHLAAHVQSFFALQMPIFGRMEFWRNHTSRAQNDGSRQDVQNQWTWNGWRISRASPARILGHHLHLYKYLRPSLTASQPEFNQCRSVWESFCPVALFASTDRDRGCSLDIGRKKQHAVLASKQISVLDIS